MPSNYFQRLAPEEIFPGNAPLEVDFGCGDGSFLLEMARHHPERRFLGVERLLGRVRKVCRLAQRADLPNLKVLRLESLYTIEWLLPPHSVSRLHLLFPDPWPKARHHKRRIVQEPFLRALEQVLVPGGEFLFKTDHPEYFDWAREEIDAFARLTTLPWTEESFFYPETDFERQWKAAGKPIYQLRCVTAS